MKTTFTVTSRDLARLLKVASEGERDEDWKIQNWILDILGVPSETSADWNDLTSKERESTISEKGIFLCCRDSLNEMTVDVHTDQDAIEIIESWIQHTERWDFERRTRSMVNPKAESKSSDN